MPYGPAIFSKANLEPHYRPFRGIMWSVVVHAAIVTALVSIPAVFGDSPGRRKLQDEAVIVDIDELRDVLYLPVLGSGDAAKASKTSESSSKPGTAAPAKVGLSYPGAQPILSDFPNPTNHIQTVLQPALVNPAILNPPLTLPNLVRLAAPPVESKLKEPDAVAAQAKSPAAVPVPLETAITAPAHPLAAPAIEPKFKVNDSVNPVAKITPAPVTPQIALAAPTRPLAAPVVEPKLKINDSINPVAKTTAPVSALSDIALAAPARPLAAPAIEPKFKITDAVNPISRPEVVLPPTSLEIAMAGPSRPLAAPIADPKLSVPDTTTPIKQAVPASGIPLDVTLKAPSRPLAAPLSESKMKVPDYVSPTARASAPATADANLPTPGPSRPLAAPAAEKLKVPDPVAPAARLTTVSPAPVASLANPSAPLSAPPSKPNGAQQNLLVLSPTPARRDQPAVIPAGEARGQFAISPQPNLSFPGTEPGTKGSVGASATGDSTASNGKTVASLINNSNASATNSGGSSASTSIGSNAAGSRPGPSNDVFPGITILGGADDSRARDAAAANTPKAPPEPLQTSYGIMILSSGGTGGGLPDFGVFGPRDQVQTVYLDMRRTILDDPISWTAEYGISQATMTATDERLTVVGSQVEVLLPFPSYKERPTIPAELARKNADRLIIAYAVINTDGTVDDVSIKQSPDPLLNNLVLDALKKWTFRPARRNGEVVRAKFLVGIPVRVQ